MTTQDIKVRIGLEGADQVQAGATRAGAALGALDAGTRKFGQGAAITGQQTAQLSAQLQDFAIQVQSGGSPLTAFLQQGSQLSAVFGGVGNAFRAVTSLITPTVAAFGAAAAAVGTVAFAYAKGEGERLAFERGIVTTGNAAGVTAGQLVELAKAAEAYGSTRGDASDVLAQLVSTGRVAGSVLGQAAEAAVRLERAGVSSVKETVAAFAELGKSPLQALLRLNETQNFLTESTYRQVRALQEAGKQSEAARVAQEAFASQGIERGKQLEESVGSIATAWRSVTKEVRNAIDAIADIGRARTPDEALADIDKRLAQLALRRQSGNRLDSNTATDLLRSQADIEAEGQSLERLRAQMAASIETSRQLAAATAARTAATKAQIEKDREAAEAAKRHADALRRQAEAQIAAGVAQARGGDMEDAGFNANFLDRYRELQAALQAGAISAGEFERAQARLIQQQPVMARQQAAVAGAIREAQAARERDLKAMLASADAAEKQVQTLRDQYIELTAGKDALRVYTDLRLEDAAAAAEQRLQSLQMVNASAEELAAAQRNAQALREQIELRKQIATATGNQATAEAIRANEQADSAARQRLYDDYREGLTEAFRAAFLQGGDFGRNFARGLAAEVQARVATALAEALAGQVLTALVGGAITGATGSGGGTNWLQGASTLNTLYNMQSGGGLFGQVLNSTWVNAALTSPAAYGAAIGTTNVAAGSQAAMLAAQTEGFGAAGTLATSQAAAGAGAGAASWGSWLSTWGALIVAGIYKANDDWKQGYRRDQARDVSETFWGGFGMLGDLQPMGGLEAAKANFLSQLGFSDKWADLLSGATAVAALFGRSAPRVDETGIRGVLGSGGFEGQAYADIVEKGGLFRSDKRYTETAAVSQELDRFLDSGTKALLDGARAYGQALGLPVEALAGVQKDVQVIFGESAEENQKALLDAISGYGDALVAQWAEAVAPLANYNETTVETIGRVAGAIGTVNQVLETLGLTALQASIAGGQAAVDLQALFGDLGTFQQAAGGYLQNYYTEAERTELSLKSIGEQLAAVGISVPGSRDAFRQLVEAQDLSTEAGREAFTVLMGVADAFAAVSSAGRSAADIAREAQQIQLDTWRAMGNDQAIRDFNRSQIAPENLPAYDSLQAFLAQQEEAAEAARQAAEAARLQKEADDLAEAARQAAYAASTAFWAAQEAAAAKVQAAWVPVWTSIAEQIAALRGEPAAGQSLADLQTQFAISTARARAGDTSAAGQLAGLAKSLVDFAKDATSTATALAVIRAQTAASLEETLRITGGSAFMPRFASGGLHSGGARLVGEAGPEVEVTGPARIYSFDQLMEMARGGAGGDAALQREILAKLTEMARLLQGVQLGVNDMHTDLRRVIEDGAIRTRADAA